MGARHGAGWLERWQQEEPLRLYLWTIAGAVLLAGVSTGLLTETWAVAIGGVAAAVLMVGGTAAARQKAWSPASHGWDLDSQHVSSWHQGYAAALETTDQPGPDHALNDDVATKAQKVLRPDVFESERDRFTPTGPTTQPRAALPQCTYMEYGVPCVLGKHPNTVRHRLRTEAPVE